MSLKIPARIVRRALGAAVVALVGLAAPVAWAQDAMGDGPQVLVGPGGTAPQVDGARGAQGLAEPLPRLPRAEGNLPAIGTDAYPAYRVVLNKIEFLRLDRPARTIVISDPAVIDISLETSRFGILQGLTVGESAFVVLDGQGEEIFAANVVVVPEAERHVTVTRDCVAATQGCAVEEEYSCGPRCVRVANPAAVESANATNPNAGNANDQGAGGAQGQAVDAATSAAGMASGGAQGGGG